MKKMILWALALVMMAAPMAAPAARGEKTELYVLAAASLTDVMAQIAESYKEVAPEVGITFVFDSSGTLQSQIEAGATADVFVSAAQRQMDALEEGGLIKKKSRKDLLLNQVVLILPASSELALSSFEDVAGDLVKMIAIGDESVPVGQYTQQIYEYLGTWDAIKAKANLGGNARAVLSWVASGDVDCGVVYATDAASTVGVKVVAQAPEGSHTPVIYPAAVVEGSQHAEAAQAFLDYLSSDTARSLFIAAGFEMAE
ncbi:MAG: molybdate ABC transporter substrate-binding protein [Clostridia bacterium]|nr:molybdate ABC transporter substrate-binding protein [Clostridia bacterium]